MKIAVPNSDWDRWFVGYAHIAVAMLVIPIMLSGCSKPQTIMHESSQQSQTDQFSTPSALLEELRVSLSRKDETRFLKCFTESDSFERCLQMAFRRVEATLRFRNAVMSIYGEGGWDQFQRFGEELGTRPRLTPNVVPIDEEWWKKLEVQTDQGQAVFFNPVTQMTNIMVKSFGGWRIDVRSALGQDVDPVKLTSYLKATTDAIEETTSEIRTNKMPLSDLGFYLFQKAAAKRSAP